MGDITLAKKAGFCFGVKKAVDEVIALQNKINTRIYTLGPLIHNKEVLKRLEDNDIFAIDISDIQNLNENDTVVIRSHGVGKKVLEKLQDKRINIIDNTCPFVKAIHIKVEKYYNEGYTIIIVGDDKHPEVIGINGWCNDTALIIRNEGHQGFIPNKICLVAQTTEKFENFQKVLIYLSNHCKEILAFNTICNATKERQEEVFHLSLESEAMIVLGDRSSSNTKKLFEISKKNCKNTILAENYEDLVNQASIEKLRTYKLGVTAGASTPDWVINKVINEIKGDNHNGK